MRDIILSHLPTAWLYTPDWTQSQESPENVKYVDRRILNSLTYMNLRSEALSYHSHTHGMFAEHFCSSLFWVLTSDCKTVLCEIWYPWIYGGFSWQYFTGFICTLMTHRDLTLTWPRPESLHAYQLAYQVDSLWIPRNFVTLLGSEK